MRRVWLAAFGCIVMLSGARARADGGSGGGGAYEWGRQQAILLDQAPVAVQTALRHEAQGRPVVRVLRQARNDGTVTYEAEILRRERTDDLLLLRDGRILRETSHDATQRGR